MRVLVHLGAHVVSELRGGDEQVPAIFASLDETLLDDDELEIVDVVESKKEPESPPEALPEGAGH